MKMFFVLVEKFLNKSMIDKEIDEKEGEDLKKINNPCLDKRKDIVKNTEISNHEIFGEFLGKKGKRREEITKPNTFLTKSM